MISRFQTLDRPAQRVDDHDVPPHEAHLSARDPVGGNRLFDLKDLITHRFDLDHTAEAYALNAAYADGVIKVMINPE